MFKYSFFIEHSFSLYVSEILCDDRIPWNSLSAKLIFVIFLVPSLCFPSNSSVGIGSPLLFRIYLVFISKFLVSKTFSRITRTAPSLIELLKFRNNNSRIIAATPGNLFVKNVSMSYFDIMLCCHLSLEALLQTMARKINRYKISSDIEACASVKTDRRRNVKFIVTNYNDRFTS